WWGHRIPAWYGPDGEIFVEASEEEAEAAAFRHYESRVKLSQDEDVLDTWFSSALWPFSTLGWPNETPELARYYPTSVLVTGFDIIFFWVARMMMFGLHFMDKEPFPEIYIHGIVRDEHGAKMSKSKGNVVDPLELIDEFGADALRFTMAALATPGRDVKPARSRIAGSRNFGTKLWNAARFCEMNECRPAAGFDPASAKLTVNRWILTEAARATNKITAGIQSYRFDEATAAVYQFVWNTFCDWYLELIKPVLNGDDEATRAETRACAAHVLADILKVLHPFMPFISEALWDELAGPGEGTLALARWPRDEFADAAAAAEINWLVELIGGIRSVRAEMNVPAAARTDLVVVGASEQTQGWLAANNEPIGVLARIDAIKLEATIPSGSVQILIGEATAALPLAGVIDFDAERARLEKEIARVDSEISRLDKKLGNEGFLAKAPEAVIQAERDKRGDYAGDRVKLEAALKRLQDAA
ncbi:MAG TPA: class I tRNA ligase family protein, partial [Afifellaceae bacterium]|nr:class I tRNA ligase family protein [Afifellaceae bacterium]